MILWAIVPAKDPALAKTRLVPALGAAARRRLSLGLLEHTVRAALATPAVSRVVVVSAAAESLALAGRLGALALWETPPAHQCDVGRVRADLPTSGPIREARSAHGADAGPQGATVEIGLNAALAQALRATLAGGADAVLVLHADLPLLTPVAIGSMVAALPGEAGAVLAPDRHRSGTNALLLRPPLALPFMFGRRSFARHVQAAWERDWPSGVRADPAFAADLDTPEDLAWLRAWATAPDGDPWLRALLADLDPAQQSALAAPLDELPMRRCGP